MSMENGLTTLKLPSSEMMNRFDRLWDTRRPFLGMKFTGVSFEEVSYEHCLKL